MKKLLFLTFASILFSCNSGTEPAQDETDNVSEQEEITDVDAQIKKDEAKADSMKKALGID